MKEIIKLRWKQILSVVIVVFISVYAIKSLSFSSLEPSEEKEQKAKFSKSYNIFALPIPKKLSFAGEDIPLQLLHVRESFDRELLVNTYWQSQTLLFLKRANRFFPEIERILKEEGIPEDFKYLALIESGLTDIVSPAGASGFWQIMKSTGKEFGLEINDYVDERYHLEKSTRVACAYIRDAKEKFGSYTLAAASYNMGMTGLEKKINQQKIENYFQLKLSEETSRYVYRIVAAKEILSNAYDYGFNFRDADLYPNWASRQIEIDSTISDLATFSIQQGINYKVLKMFNPWLRSNELPVKTGNKYIIHLPLKEQMELFIAYQ